MTVGVCVTVGACVTVGVCVTVGAGVPAELEPALELGAGLTGVTWLVTGRETCVTRAGALAAT